MTTSASTAIIRLRRIKFRRQVPMGNYVLDFICYEKNLVIELDGGQHSIEQGKDEKRDNWLKQQGFKILRFWNNEILTNIASVLEVIRKSCLSPSPYPSHQGRGMKEDNFIKRREKRKSTYEK
jgi:very-short-patch-repair endonuclease